VPEFLSNIKGGGGAFRPLTSLMLHYRECHLTDLAFCTSHIPPPHQATIRACCLVHMPLACTVFTAHTSLLCLLNNIPRVGKSSDRYGNAINASISPAVTTPTSTMVAQLRDSERGFGYQTYWGTGHTLILVISKFHPKSHANLKLFFINLFCCFFFFFFSTVVQEMGAL